MNQVTSQLEQFIFFIFFSAAAYNKLCLLVGRFLVGLGMGLEGSLHSLYVVELMSKHFRGPFVTSGVITITLGILVIYVIGSFLPWHVRMKIEYLHSGPENLRKSRPKKTREIQ